MARFRNRRKPASRKGAGFLLFLLLAPLPGSCGPGEGSPPDPELEGARALGLARGARLHRVVLGGRGSEEHVLPGRIQANRGDAVEFVTVDHRIHTVVFPRDSLTAESFRFLAESGTEASPPLPARGSRFLLRLEGAPPGRYPFLSQAHGGVAHGVIEVAMDGTGGLD